MLDKSCPKCGTLIYRLPNKKIVCPSCESEIIIQKESLKNEKKTSLQLDTTPTYNFAPLINTIFMKIDQCRIILHNESDTTEIEKLVIVIGNLVRLYKKVKLINSPTNRG